MNNETMIYIEETNVKNEVSQRNTDGYVYISPILENIKKYINQKNTNDKDTFQNVVNFIIKTENTTVDKLFKIENNNTEHWIHSMLFVYLLDGVLPVLGNEVFKNFEYNVINPLTMLVKDEKAYFKKDFIELYFHTDLSSIVDIIPSVKNKEGELYFDIQSLKEYWKMLYVFNNKNKTTIELLARLKQLVLLQSLGLQKCSSLLIWATFDNVSPVDVEHFAETNQLFNLGFYHTKYYKQLQSTKRTTTTYKVSEKHYQQKLHNKYGGEIEVKTPVGYIDLLTENKLFELKTHSEWKSAIGQLLTYGAYYPKHEKVLALFNSPKVKNDSEIVKNCKKLGITLKYI